MSSAQPARGQENVYLFSLFSVHSVTHTKLLLCVGHTWSIITITIAKSIGCLPRTCAQSLSHVWLFCNPMNSSPPGSFAHGISQARILEWVAISFPRGCSTHRPNPGLLHWKVNSLLLRYKGSPPVYLVLFQTPTSFLSLILSRALSVLPSLYSHLQMRKLRFKLLARRPRSCH